MTEYSSHVTVFMYSRMTEYSSHVTVFILCDSICVFTYDRVFISCDSIHVDFSGEWKTLSSSEDLLDLFLKEPLLRL